MYEEKEIEEIKGYVEGKFSGRESFRLKFNRETLYFTFHVEEIEELGEVDYFIQRIQNKFYGWVFAKVSDEFIVVPGYPHLKNIKEENILEIINGYAELKENGTNTGLMWLPKHKYLVVRTRMTFLNPSFPVMLFSEKWLSELGKTEKGREAASRFREEREKILKKYPNWFVSTEDKYYVRINARKAVKDILNEKYPLLLKSSEGLLFLSRNMVFLELIGRINPIQVDPECKVGMYNFDYDLVLIDILNLRNYKWFPRLEKEKVAERFNLRLVKKWIVFGGNRLKDAIDKLREESLASLREGFVVKQDFTGLRVKVKHEQILRHGRILGAVAKGEILPEDLEEYIDRAVQSVKFNPEEIETAFIQALEEAKTDYPEEVVLRNEELIKEKIMILFAQLEALKKTRELLKKNKSKREILRELNFQLPRTLPFLKGYLSLNKERIVKGEERKRLKRKRMKIMKPVVNFLLEKIGNA